MSRMVVFKTKIVNTNIPLLKKALNALAQTMNARVKVYSERDERNAEIDFILESGRIIFVRVRNGRLEFSGDSSYSHRIEEISQKIVQTYVHFALLQQLQAMGYKLQNVQQLENGAIFGEVVRV